MKFPRSVHRVGCSVSLSAVFLLWPALGARAQVVSPHAQSQEKTISFAQFTLTTDQNGHVDIGQPGHTGDVAEPRHWDGTYHTEEQMSPNPPSETTQVQVQNKRLLAPEEKPFYVSPTARITLPASIAPPSTVSVRATRVRYTTTGTTTTMAPVAGTDPITLTLYLISSANNLGKAYFPEPDGQGNTIYSYRMHLMEDNELLPPRLAGTADWNVTDKLGRWQLQLDPASGQSAPVEFKIDKREQIAKTALDWVGYWPVRPEASQLNEMAHHSVTLNKTLFSGCHSFAGYIYHRHGLYPAYDAHNATDPALDPDAIREAGVARGDDPEDIERDVRNAIAAALQCGALQAHATAEDDQVGALRLFSSPVHTGVITARLGALLGRMVDVNNPAADDDDKGVRERDWTYVIHANPTQFQHQNTLDPNPNRTLPAPDTASDPAVTDPVTLKSKSWLKILEEE